jgi:hypothetical protein
MKKFIVLLICLCPFASIFAQKILVDDVKNNVRRIRTNEYTVEFDNFFDIYLEKFMDNNTTQYFICGESEENEYHNFPPKAQMLIKLMNDNTIELTAVYTELRQTSESSWKPTAYYPITESQLQDIINTGVKKIRVVMLSYNKKDDSIFTDLADKEFKKDKIGTALKERYELINKMLSIEVAKQEQEKKATSTQNVHSNF